MVLAGPALGADVVVVQAEGTALKTKDAKDAKKAALETALKNVVFEALASSGVLEDSGVGPSAVAEEITAAPMKFVLNYRILSEGWVTAPRGGPGGVPDPLGGQPAQGPEPWPGARSDSGPPTPPWMEEGQGWGEEEWSSPGRLYSIRIEASVDVIELRGAVATALAGGVDGLETITVYLLDAVDYPAYSYFGRSLKRIGMVKDVSYDSFYRGRIAFKVKSLGSVLDLKEALSKEIGGDYVVQFGGPKTLTARAVRPGRRR